MSACLPGVHSQEGDARLVDQGGACPGTGTRSGTKPQDLEAVDSQLYIQSMRRFAGGVNIITSADGRAWAGLTATAVCSLSAYPPRILCCINQNGVTLNVIRTTANFCVNILSKEHRGLAERFAGIGDIGGEDRFEEGDWRPLKTGAPALEGALLAFDCALETAIEYDTHAIIVGKVVAVDAAEPKAPLLWLNGAFATASPWPDESA